MEFKSVLIILALCANYKVNADDDTIPPEYLKQVLEIKQITDTLQANGQSLNLFSHMDVSPRISESEVSFEFYSSNNSAGIAVKISDIPNLKTLTTFNTEYPTIFVSHGWHNTYQSAIIEILKSAYFNKTAKLNYFAVNWDKYAALDYVSAFLAVPSVGKYLGEFINNLTTIVNYDLANVTLVGHSLGAHVVGCAGKTASGKVGTIVGLDPAGPGYFENVTDIRLTATDGQYVQALHTDAQFLGLNYAVGDSDFWPNGGYTQPGCELDIFGRCSHTLAYQYFAESILYNSYMGKKCDSYDSFKSGDCTGELGEMGGETIDAGSSGNYYFRTNKASPYGMGTDGTNA